MMATRKYFRGRLREQFPTRATSISTIMRSTSFRRGVDEARAGRPPRYDAMDDWDYERGRQWGKAAPKTMPVLIGREVNPKAIAIYMRSKIQ
jgi:hypothetical protein